MKVGKLHDGIEGAYESRNFVRMYVWVRFAYTDPVFNIVHLSIVSIVIYHKEIRLAKKINTRWKKLES